MKPNQLVRGFALFWLTLSVAGLVVGVCLYGPRAYSQAIDPAPMAEWMRRPSHGLSLPCKVVSVHDGDTLTAEVTIRANIRLIDCWAPELSEDGGKESRDRLSRIAIGRTGTLFVPIGPKADNLADLLTFGRVLGHVWIDGQRQNLSELQIERRQAARRKGAPLGE